MPFPLHWYCAALAVNHGFEAAGVPVRMTFPECNPSVAEVVANSGGASVPPAFRPKRRSEFAHHAIGVAHA